MSKGPDLEYAVMEALREQGWYCIRSSGSHGIVDIIALRKRSIVVVQCKYDRGRVESEEWRALWDLADDIGATPYIADRSGPRKSVVMWQVLGIRPARKHMSAYLTSVRFEVVA